MTQLLDTRNRLEALTSIDWFDAMCDILKRDNNPTTRQLIEIVGLENTDIGRRSRGSKFLIPFDQRFRFACINPDLLPTDNDKPIEHLSFGGSVFELPIIDIIKRFPSYRTQTNTYDGGTQLFLYPLPDVYDFSALSFNTAQEDEDAKDVSSLVLHSVTFNFGNSVFLARDGYHTRR